MFHPRWSQNRGSKTILFLGRFLTCFLVTFWMVFGGQNSFKIRSKRVEKLFLFLCSLFLVPRRSFDGFEASFRYFPSILVSSGLRNYGFCIGKEHFSKRVLLWILAAPDSCLGALRANLGLSSAPKRAQNSSKVVLEVIPKWTPKLITFWTSFGLILGAQN